MRRYQPVVLGLIAAALSSTAWAQSTPSNSKASIIAAMKDPAAAPPSEESDVIPLPGVTQKGFSLGLSGATKKPAAQAVDTRNAPTVRRAQNTATTRSPKMGSARSPFNYGRALDMRVTFDLNSAVLTEQGKAEARVFADAMKSPELAGKRFIVAGHTDTLGSNSLNQALSRRRAQSVVDFLTAQGADRSRLVAAGFGSSRPRADTSPSDPSNRRVEFARTN